MNKRLVERIGMAALIAALVAYFCYQVAYGVSETVTNGNITATMTAPPGSNITHTGLKIVPEGIASNFTIKNYSSVNIANSTWTMYNSTSGSVSTIKFKSTEVQDEPGWYSDVTTFVRIRSYTQRSSLLCRLMVG